jgi:hypothetical protein
MDTLVDLSAQKTFPEPVITPDPQATGSDWRPIAMLLLYTVPDPDAKGDGPWRDFPHLWDEYRDPTLANAIPLTKTSELLFPILL